MSKEEKQYSEFDDTSSISTEDNLLGSSVSLTLEGNSVHIKEKPVKDNILEKENIEAGKTEQWWLKKPSVQLENGVEKNSSTKKPLSTISSPDISNSTKDFLNKEKFCKDIQNDKLSKSKDDTCDNVESTDFDKYQSDFESSVTDKSFGSILDDINKEVKISESNKEQINTRLSIDEEESIENILQEVEGLSKKSKDVKPKNMKLEKMNEKNGIVSDKHSTEKSISTELSNENTINKNDHAEKVQIPKEDLLEEKPSNNKNYTEKRKVDLDDEITGVDKDFFDTLLRKSQENTHTLSNNSSFDQEDFTNFLKLLQEQTDKDDDLSLVTGSANNSKNSILSSENVTKEKNNNENIKRPSNFNSTGKINDHPSLVGDSHIDSKVTTNKELHKKNIVSPRTAKIRRVADSKQELYTVSLTPRLELFADDIPKLLAEKTHENHKSPECSKKSTEKVISPKSTDGEDFSFRNFKALEKLKLSTEIKDHTNIKNVQDVTFIDFNDHSLEKKNSSSGSAGHRRGHSESYKTSNSLDHFVSATDSRIVIQKRISKSSSSDQLTRSSIKLKSPLETTKSFRNDDYRKSVPPALPKKTTSRNKLHTKVSPKYSKTKVDQKSMEECAKHINGVLDIKGNQMKTYADYISQDFGGGDFSNAPMDESVEMIIQEERYRFVHLKQELESEIEAYKCKIKDIQILHEQEMLSLKKQNIILKAKIEEKSHREQEEAELEQKIRLLQKEMTRQENVIMTYESENKKLIQEIKNLQNEMKKNTIKPKIIASSNSETQELIENLKDMQEENVKLQLEVSNLKEKYSDYTMKNDDLIQQNALLQDELEMIKDQLNAKNEYINDRLQIMTTNELELRRTVEDLRVELGSKTEQLKCLRNENQKFQNAFFPLEKELLELRAACANLQDKLQTITFNFEREKQLTEKLKDQVVLDNKKIIDLNRQIREMERILKRKNPDSVSALILAANSENENLNLEKVKLLEERIAFLENEIKVKENMSQEKLNELQKKFAGMKEKYSTENDNTEKNIHQNVQSSRKIYVDSSIQTIYSGSDLKDYDLGLDKEEKKANKTGPKSQNAKEDTHLIATIRGLKNELSNKDKTLNKLTKEFHELQKTNRRLQKEREKLLNDKRNGKSFENEKMNKLMTASDSKLFSVGYSDRKNDHHPFNMDKAKKLSSSAQKLYDPSQFSEDSEGNKIKKLTNENQVLKEEMSKLNKEFVALKNKRLHDLNILQEEHEKEIASIIKEYSSRVGNSKILKLQGQISSQMTTISHLKQQIEELRDYKEQVLILKTERDHLEWKVRSLSEKVKYLSTPGSQQLQNLQEKIAVLQQRHESRELTLQKLVRDLLRSKTQCKDCKGDRGKQLCYFRQELDNIITMLQELSNI